MARFAAVRYIAAGLLSIRAGGAFAAVALVGGAAAPPAPSGVLWHDSFATDTRPGSKVSRFSGGPSRLLDSNATAVPSPDGTHYGTFEYAWRQGVGTTLVALNGIDWAAGRTRQRYAHRFDGYIRELRPSPRNPALLLVKWSSSATSNDPYLAILDLARQTVLDKLPGTGAAADWLPDGRYVYLDATGQLFAAEPGGARSPGGRITVPGRKVRALWVNRQGTQLLSRWERQEGDRILKDLWISTVSGAGLRRFTAIDRTDTAVWSPDGRRVAFTTRSNHVCTGFDCANNAGHCELQQVDSAARAVIAGSTALSDLRVRDRTGKSVILGCDLRGWTP